MRRTAVDFPAAEEPGGGEGHGEEAERGGGSGDGDAEQRQLGEEGDRSQGGDPVAEQAKLDAAR